jgi:hypothetical protein
MAWVQYDKYQESLMNQVNAIDHDDNASTTIKIALVTSSYTPNRATHDFWDDVSTNEVSGTNYTAGGNALASKTVTTATNITTWDANDPATWSQSGSGFSNARYAILYKDTGTPATSPLIAYHDFGSDKGNVDGDLTIQLDSAGIATIS